MDADSGQSPPPPDDKAGWRQVIRQGRLSTCPPEAIVATVQSMGPFGDAPIVGALMKHLSDRITGILRRRIGTNHPNAGIDIIERARDSLIDAILDADSVDGAGLRVAFRARVEFRAADAIRAESLNAARYPSYEVEGTLPAARKGAWSEADELAHVEALLGRIDDPRKRMAFRLHMEGVPNGSAKFESIAKALGICAKTAGEWVAEVQSQLKGIVGDER